MKFDRYALCARVVPAMFVAIPLVLAVLPWLPPEAFAAKGIAGQIARVAASGTVVVALSFVLAQLSRGRGGRLESRLWQEWGGRPSAAFLRHRDPALGSLQKRDLHARLRRANPELHLPSAEEEVNAPLEAEHCYDRASAWLRNRTRDPKKFPLLFEDNLAYGFRRNLLALRPYAVGAAVIGATSGLIALWLVGTGWLVAAISITTGGFTLLNGQEDVRRQSDKFTRSLFEALDALELPRSRKARGSSLGAGSEKGANSAS